MMHGPINIRYADSIYAAVYASGMTNDEIEGTTGTMAWRK